jgi:hypothetical protein
MNTNQGYYTNAQGIPVNSTYITHFSLISHSSCASPPHSTNTLTTLAPNHSILTRFQIRNIIRNITLLLQLLCLHSRLLPLALSLFQLRINQTMHHYLPLLSRLPLPHNTNQSNKRLCNNLSINILL